MNKRELLRTSAVTGLGLFLGDRVWARFAELPTEQLAQDDTFWTAIRAKHRLKPDCRTSKVQQIPNVVLNTGAGSPGL